MGNGVVVWVGGTMIVVLAKGSAVGCRFAAATEALSSFPVAFNTTIINRNNKKTVPARAIGSKLERGELSFIIERGE